MAVTPTPEPIGGGPPNPGGAPMPGDDVDPLVADPLELQVTFIPGELSNTGDWRIMVTNTDINYPFMGETPTEQLAHVKALGEYMSEYASNPDLLVDQLCILIDLPAGSTTEETIQTLFGATSALLYEEAAVCTAAEGAFLIDCMEDAGEALLVALP